MRALAVADPPITEIVSMSTQFSRLIPMGCFVMTPSQVHDVAMRFKVLTKLRLSLRKEDTDQNEGTMSYVVGRSVARALSAAVKLRSLFIIHNGTLDDEEETWTYCSILLKGCRFPELRSLVLAGFDAEEEELLEVLEASPRLENLFLCGVIITAGLWASAATRMRSIFQLKRVEVIGLQDDATPPTRFSAECEILADHRHVEDFFLRDGENPFTRQAVKAHYDKYPPAQRGAVNTGICDYEKFFREHW